MGKKLVYFLPGKNNRVKKIGCSQMHQRCQHTLSFVYVLYGQGRNMRPCQPLNQEFQDEHGKSLILHHKSHEVQEENEAPFDVTATSLVFQRKNLNLSTIAALTSSTLTSITNFPSLPSFDPTPPTDGFDTDGHIILSNYAIDCLDTQKDATACVGQEDVWKFYQLLS